MIIPEPIVGGIFCVMFGMITAFGMIKNIFHQPYLIRTAINFFIIHIIFKLTNLSYQISNAASTLPETEFKLYSIPRFHNKYLIRYRGCTQFLYSREKIFTMKLFYNFLKLINDTEQNLTSLNFSILNLLLSQFFLILRTKFICMYLNYF